MRRFLIPCRSRLGERSGVAAVEFAIVAPVLVTLLGAAVDLGTAIERTIHLENAARAGAQWITKAPTDLTGAQAAAQALLTTGGTATTAESCQCPPTGAATGGSVVSCTSTCATGLIRYVTVTATRPFTPIFPTSTLIPFNALGASNASVVARLL